MSDHRAIVADFADLRTVKSRSTVQLILEAPIEEGERIVQMFGFPRPGNPVKLAVARLDMEKATEAPQRRVWGDLAPAQQAGIRCNEPAFWAFLRDQGDASCDSADRAAVYVRFVCGVKSRADIAKSNEATAKWNDLERKYQVWLADPAEAAE